MPPPASEFVGEFVRVAALADLPSGAALRVEVAGRAVALFNVAGRVYAVENACPHRGAPLVRIGYVEPAPEAAAEASPRLTCADHGWSFRLDDGRFLNDAVPDCDLAVWDVRIEGGEVLVSREPRRP